MKRLINICLFALLPLLLIGGVVIWYASTSIKPDQLTQLIGSSVKEATGRDLTIAGPVSLRFFPSIAVTAQQVSLSNATWSSHSEMVKVKRLELDIELLPLLRKEVAFNAINLNGVEVYLQTNKAGDANWDFTQPVTTGINSRASNAMSANSQSSDPMSTVRFRDINIVDAQIHYRTDDSIPKRIQIAKLSIVGNGNKTSLLGRAQYGQYQLSLKGKTGNLREAFNDWGINTVKVPINLNLTLNNKTVDVDGMIEKNPKSEPHFNLQVNSKSFELAPLAGATALAGVDPSNNKEVSTTKSSSKFFFSDDALPFDVLPQAKGTLAMNVDELGIPGHVPITGFKGSLVLDGSKMSAQDLTFGLGGKGSVSIQASITGIQSANPAIAVKGMAKGITLEQMLDMLDSKAKVKGGNTEIAFNLRSSGSSLHQLLGRANGVAQIAIADSVLDASFINAGGDLLITVVNAVNPMRKRTDQTTLECAVAYLPINNGQIVLNNSFGVVTDQLNLTMSGSVDLKTESLNIKIDPKDKSGLTTGVNLGGLVQLQGTLLDPQVGFNKEGIVTSAVSIGLGILTGGATILAENAKSIATKNAVQPCKAAMHSWSDIYPGVN